MPLCVLNHASTGCSQRKEVVVAGLPCSIKRRRFKQKAWGGGVVSLRED